MRVDNLALGDYHNVANGLGPHWQTAFDPAVVSFDVVWSGPITRRVHVADGTLGNNYAGEYVENQVTVTWSGTNLKEGFTFTANPGTLATSSVDGGFAELGHERNGSFFSADSALGGAPGGSSAAPATTQTNLLPTSQRTAAPADTPVETAQPVQPATAPEGLAAMAAHPGVLDQLFAGLDGGELSDVLRADAALP
jgi:hypothetical protein